MVCSRPVEEAGTRGEVTEHSETHGLHILHIAAPAPYGGLESVIRSLARGQLIAGSRVDVVAIHEPLAQPHPFVEALTSEGICVHVIQVRGRGYLSERAAVRALCRSIKPSIVHSHGYRPDFVDAPVARAEDIPTVTTVHGFTGYGWRGRIYEKLQRHAMHRFDAVIAVSQPIASELLRDGIEPARLYTIPNALDEGITPLPRDAARKALGLDRDSFVVGWVGRLSPEKGPDVFLDALALLKDTNVRACIVGDGPERARLESQAVRLGVSDRIKWTGSIPDAGRIFSAFDTFVLSSRTEGTPVVLIEAVNAGVAVIATRVGGIPDLVSEKEAFLVNPLAPAEIASAVRLVQSAADEALGRTVAAGERLQARNRHKSWVSDYDRVYRTLLDNRG